MVTQLASPRSVALVLSSVALLLSPGCKKSSTDQPPVSGRSSDPATAPSSAPAAPSAAPISDAEDHIVVLAKHRPAKQSDPVRVRFAKFSVVKASFDPNKIEGGTATIELDLASLESGNGERDKDLASPTYIDVGKFATVTIEVANVKKTADKTFTADAVVKLRGVTKTYPVTFDVIEQRTDAIRIKGEHTFSRLDFSIGTDPASDSQQQVDTELTIQMVVTVKNT